MRDARPITGPELSGEQLEVCPQPLQRIRAEFARILSVCLPARRGQQCRTRNVEAIAPRRVPLLAPAVGLGWLAPRLVQLHQPLQRLDGPRAARWYLPVEFLQTLLACQE